MIHSFKTHRISTTFFMIPLIFYKELFYLLQFGVGGDLFIDLAMAFFTYDTTIDFL